MIILWNPGSSARYSETPEHLFYAAFIYFSLTIGTLMASSLQADQSHYCAKLAASPSASIKASSR